MAVVGRVAEDLRDGVLDVLGDGVLQDLGLVVDPVPGDAERVVQVQLQQAVVPDDLQGDLGAAVGQLHALVPG